MGLADLLTGVALERLTGFLMLVVGTFAAAWLGAHRVKALAKYHHPIVIGTGLAAAQSLVLMFLVISLTFIQFRFVERRIHYT
jgi:hypothetical protein